MKTRVISGIIMVPLLLVIYFGGIWLWAAATLIALVGLSEFYNGFRNMDIEPSNAIGYVLTAALFGVLGVMVWRGTPVESAFPLLMLWMFLSVAAGFIYGWKITVRGPYDAMATVCGLVYIPFFAAHIVLLDQTEYRLMTWIIVLAAFGSDIFAYFTGYLIGKHKMAPNLSPKKTVEGGIGGVVGGALLAGLFGVLFYKEQLTLCIVLGLIGAAAAEAGDLTASAFKRRMGIKDYGHLIPGHGGIMDRFDSVLFVAPVIYYLTMMITQL
ncbi:MAG: phosphatidate cytidylyltransferase [Mogibacterium sp.]|nr:phosphatidate cytidylyltransferase [Mogibacterium sp.]